MSSRHREVPRQPIGKRDMANEAKHVIHMVGHGHIDPTWLWRWTEGFEEVRATFRSALERLEETPAFKFTASSACFYRWVKDSDPALFERIKARVQEGRWELSGGFWVEPDCNIPCGESFVRHGLYSQRFFAREFGVQAKVGFNPDSFGHAGSLPQILKKLGIDYYVYMRPSPDVERPYPKGTTFWWEGRDGSRVLACNLQVCYSTENETRERIAHLDANPHLNPGQEHVLGFYGVGNHGGGPTKEAIAQIQEAQGDANGPDVRFSTLLEYFKGFLETSPADGIPAIRDELQYHARGCYSAHSEMKQLNRRVEHALMTAERFATAAWLLDAQEYPHAPFEKAWLDLLYNQFHDILAGTSIESAYRDTRDQMGAARHRADVIINQSVQSIARDIDTTAEGNTVVVFNPLAWPVTQPVIVSPIIERALEAPLHLVDSEEHTVPLQQIRGERVAGRQYAFTAELPAMGYRLYHARSGAKSRKLIRRLEAGRDFLENEWWRLEFDGADGSICRLFDKHRHVEVLRRGGILSSLVDHSDTWSHEVEEYRVEAGRFGNAALELVESGDVLATVRATTRLGRSEAIAEVTLYRTCEFIDYTLRVNWQERYHTLKLAFDTCVEQGAATYDTAYGCEERPANGQEEPGQQWFDLTGLVKGLPYGFAVLNDSKFGFDVKDGTMRVTVLRSPAYAHHDPARYEADSGHPIMDQGWQTCRFRLAPHESRWQDSRIVKQSWELNVPARTHVESAHPGTRPSRATLLGTDSHNVLISVVKQSEEGGEVIVRGYETSGEAAKTTLYLPFAEQSFELAFAPHEIKTVRIDPKTWQMRAVNLLEE